MYANATPNTTNDLVDDIIFPFFKRQTAIAYNVSANTTNKDIMNKNTLSSTNKLATILYTVLIKNKKNLTVLNSKELLFFLEIIYIQFYVIFAYKLFQLLS